MTSFSSSSSLKVVMAPPSARRLVALLPFVLLLSTATIQCDAFDLHAGFVPSSSLYKLNHQPSTRRSTSTPIEHCYRASSSTQVSARRRNTNNSNDDNRNNSNDALALPASGASSFWSRPRDENTYISYESSELIDSPESSITPRNIIVSEHTGLVTPKFKLQYTCKICSTRNSHTVTRMAYRKGVVIAMCKGCESKHLIADNLGWSNYDGGFAFDKGETDIEKYMLNRNEEMKKSTGGREVDVDGEVEEALQEDIVLRVQKEVFDLENALHQEKGRGENIISEVIGGEESDNWN